MTIKCEDIDFSRSTGLVQFFETLPDHIKPLQKAIPPYMNFEKGYGYMGVMLLDTDTDRVQCHYCGRWFKALSAHLQVHKITANEYKDEVGLYRSEGLMALTTKYKWQIANKGQRQKNLIKTQGQFSDKANQEKLKVKNGSSKMQWKNKYGTCDAQLKFRLDEAISRYGRVPMTKEEPNLINCLTRRYGSWNKALAKYGLSPYIGRTTGGIRHLTESERREREKEKLERENVVAPKCIICKKNIERKINPNGKMRDMVRWLNQKTCCREHHIEYVKQKSLINFRQCAFKGCESKHQAKGYCMKHYMQIEKPNRDR